MAKQRITKKQQKYLEDKLDGLDIRLYEVLKNHGFKDSYVTSYSLLPVEKGADLQIENDDNLSQQLNAAVLAHGIEDFKLSGFSIRQISSLTTDDIRTCKDGEKPHPLQLGNGTVVPSCIIR